VSVTESPAPASDRDSADARAAAARLSRAVWLIVVTLLLAGIGVRALALRIPPPLAAGTVGAGAGRWRPTSILPFLENDERIYLALVEQLEAGRGYTLQGHPIIDEPWIAREQYDHPLFYHPPGGVALFWLAHRTAGESGFALVQVSAFAVFFCSVMLLGWCAFAEPPPHGGGRRVAALGATGRSAALGALAVLAAGTPIMAHVTGRLWLDGPLLALSTAAAATFLLAARRNGTALAALAGVLLGWASLVKLTAVLVLPGAVALAWAVAPAAPDGERPPGGLLRRTMVFAAVAAAVQLPWELWQWAVVGSPFPTWAGRPVPWLVRNNAYVRYLTVVRSPWAYTVLLPRVLWTLVPSLVLLAGLRRNAGIAKRGAALLLWIAVVVGAHVALGAIGYAKLLRLVILVTPATVVLFGLAVGGAVDVLGERPPRRRAGWTLLLLLALAGLAAEGYQGMKTAFHDNRFSDLIVPLTGLPQ